MNFVRLYRFSLLVDFVNSDIKYHKYKLLGIQMRIKISQHEPLLITFFRVSDGLIGVFLLWAIVFFGGGEYYVEVYPIIFFAILVSFSSVGVYQSWRMRLIRKELGKLMQGCGTVYLLLFAIIYVLKPSFFFPRMVILSWMFVWPTVLFVQRATVRSLLRYYRKRGRNIKRAVIVGSYKIGGQLEHLIHENPWVGIWILGYFDDSPSNPIEENSCIGSLEKLPNYVHNNNVDIVYIALPMHEEGKIKRIIEKIIKVASCSIYLAPYVSFSNPININGISFIGDVPLFHIADTPFYGIKAVVKRAEDIVLGILFLIIASPAMLTTAIVIKLTSHGPVIFKQWRYGLKGRLIEIWKFRTLNVCENGDEVNQVVESDPRLTKLGKFLRRMSIDELPQFFNVLQGRLSVVGPRPHVPKFVDDYCKNGYITMMRHNVKPGITGLAQLYGTRKAITNKEQIKERYRYDLEYINNWSLWLDMKIIFLTIFYLFKKYKDVL